MAAHRYIDRICLTGAALSLLLSLLFMNGQALGLQPASRVMGYEARLFDTSKVHNIDIVMDGWDAFIDGCEDEEYASCAVVVNGEAYRNVGLRAKGNTSLSTVSQLGSDRYSFKLEFDHCDSGKTYYGLDKLSLNNVIQDNTFMKDYLVYQMMTQFGANAPLCSYVYITVNGEGWGLYLAVEGIEDSFLQRNYGQSHGELYKPDTTGFGGGRGNGKEFDIGDIDFSGFDRREATPDGFDFESFASGGANPDSFDFEGFASRERGFGGFGGGMGSSDVKLQYIDDDPDNYSNIFDNAKTDITEADKIRLIQSLKALSQGGGPSEVVDVDQVLRYFVVHDFVVNGDSYTGSIVHNYYLYEEGGRLSMLPWDYNLAFGTFQGGDASSAVNDPIDSPLSVTGSGDRPMADWIFSSEAYTALYYQYFQEFLDTVDPAALISETYTLIAPYVDRDPTKFCTTEEFETGVETLKGFCQLRAQSVSGQLTGAIPSTKEGQSADPASLVDTSSLCLSDMGTMNNGGGFGGGPGGRGSARTEEGALPAFGASAPSASSDGNGEMPGRQPFEDRQRPDGIEAGAFGGFPDGGFSGNDPPSGGSWGDAPDDGGSQTGTTLLLLGVSSLVLLAGLAVAFKFKR